MTDLYERGFTVGMISMGVLAYMITIDMTEWYWFMIWAVICMTINYRLNPEDV